MWSSWVICSGEFYVVSKLYNWGQGGGNILLTDANQALLCSGQLTTLALTWRWFSLSTWSLWWTDWRRPGCQNKHCASPLWDQLMAKKLQLVDKSSGLSLGPRRSLQFGGTSFQLYSLFQKLNNLVKCIHSCLQWAPTSHLSSSDDWYLNDSWSSIRSRDKVRFLTVGSHWDPDSLPINSLWGGALFLQHIYCLLFTAQRVSCNSNYNDQAQVLIKKACRHCQPIILRPETGRGDDTELQDFRWLVVVWQLGDTRGRLGRDKR